MEKDDLYNDVEKYIITLEEIRPSLLQIKFRLGYMRANSLIIQLEHYGIIVPILNTNNFKVL